MKTIDFLPERYRQRAILRQARIWWVMVIVVFGSAIGSAAATQAWLKHGLHRQLAELAAPFATAQDQVRELSRLQAQIDIAAQEASLFSYLEHPWPRTQLLAQVVRPLSDSIRLTHLSIAEEDFAARVGHRQPPADDPNAVAALPSAAHDLGRLSEQMESRQTVIVLEGQTNDAASLHAYVAALGVSPLIAAASIKSLEVASDKNRGATGFVLRLIVRPGCAQRGNQDATSTRPAVAAIGGGA